MRWESLRTMSAADITDDEAAELLAALVAIPSVNPHFRAAGEPDEWFNEARLADFVGSLAEERRRARWRSRWSRRSDRT